MLIDQRLGFYGVVQIDGLWQSQLYSFGGSSRGSPYKSIIVVAAPAQSAHAELPVHIRHLVGERKFLPFRNDSDSRLVC